MRSSFGVRVTFSFLAVVAFSLVATLVVLERATTSRLAEAITETRARMERVDRGFESARIKELDGDIGRFHMSPRLAGALQAAIEENSAQIILAAAAYELELANSIDHLAVFASQDGKFTTAMLDGKKFSVPKALARMPPTDPGEARYVRQDGDLFLLVARDVKLGSIVVGRMALGKKMVPAAIKEGAELVGVETCYYADGKCLLGTRDFDGPLGSLAVRAVKAKRDTVVRDASWAVIATKLAVGSGEPIHKLVAVRLSPIAKPFERIKTALYLTGITALLLASLAALTITRGLVAPIRDLVRAAERVARGDLSLNLKTDREDELGMLAKAFGVMTKSLSEGKGVQTLFMPKVEGGRFRRARYEFAFEPFGHMTGDWIQYDVRPDRCTLAIGDVSGKGPSAALATAVIASAWRQHDHSGAEVEPYLKELVLSLNEAVLQTFSRQLFSTLSIICIQNDKITFGSFGAPPWITISGGVVTSLRAPPSDPLGLQSGVKIRLKEMALDDVDMIFAFTDGVMEGRQYLRRLREMAETNPMPKSDQAFDWVKDCARRAGVGEVLPDDFTMMMVRVDPKPPSGA